MLILTRKAGDRGVIVELPSGQTIEIFIEKTQGKQVTVTFNNEKNIRIWRGELWDKMQKDKLNHFDH